MVRCTLPQGVSTMRTILTAAGRNVLCSAENTKIGFLVKAELKEWDWLGIARGDVVELGHRRMRISGLIRCPSGESEVWAWLVPAQILQ
jgi:hypothetical protein